MSCFLSYAADDGEDRIGQFKDLIQQRLKRRRGQDVDIFSAPNISLGRPWPHAICEALGSARIFLFVNSPTYWSRNQCRIEWKVFSERIARQREYLKQVDLMIPIPWVPLRDVAKEIKARIPPEARDLNNCSGKYRGMIKQEGIERILIQRDAARRQNASTSVEPPYSAVLEEYTQSLVNRILELTNDDSATGLVDDDIQPSDLSKYQEEASGTRLRQLGPRYVKVGYLAAVQSEIKTKRSDLTPYGKIGGQEWKPIYSADTESQADWIAQRAATLAGKICIHRPDVRSILDEWTQAREDKNIALAIVDPWSIALEGSRYESCVRRLPSNVGPVIQYMNDEETEGNRSELESSVQKLLPRRSRPTSTWERQEIELVARLAKAMVDLGKEIDSKPSPFDHTGDDENATSPN